MTKLVVDKKCPPLGALFAAEAAKAAVKVAVTWGEDTSYSLQDGAIGSTTSVGISR